MLVLLIEPDEKRRRETAARLAGAGCLVRAAASAWEGLAMLQEEPLPRAVLMDLASSEACADWLAGELRSDERLSQLPIYGTAEALRDLPRQRLRPGASGREGPVAIARLVPARSHS